MVANIYDAPGYNRLLSILPPSDRSRLVAMMQRRTFELNEMVVRPGEPLSFVCFPLTTVVSLMRTFDDAASVAVGTVGNDGMVGYSLVYGQDRLRSEVIARIPGEALVMRTADFRNEVSRNEALRSIVGCYVMAMMQEMAASIGCSVRHSIKQRCARRLLMTHDRIGVDSFPLTQEFLALMLGVRRSGVSVAASELQRAGLIVYHRGQITILDRTGLELAACECYHVAREDYDQIMASVAQR